MASNVKNKAKTRRPFVELGRPHRWPKGKSGNPNGRPRTAKFSEAVKQIAAEIDPKTGLTGGERLAKYCFGRALRGSARHAEFVLGYSEGKPGQRLEISGPEGGPLELQNLSLADLEAKAFELMSGMVANPLDVAGVKLRETLLTEGKLEPGTALTASEEPSAVATAPQDTAKASGTALLAAMTPERLRARAVSHYLTHPNPAAHKDCLQCQERLKAKRR